MEKAITVVTVTTFERQRNRPDFLFHPLYPYRSRLENVVEGIWLGPIEIPRQGEWENIEGVYFLYFSRKNIPDTVYNKCDKMKHDKRKKLNQNGMLTCGAIKSEASATNEAELSTKFDIT